MHGRRRIIFPVVLVAVVVLAAGVWYANDQAAANGALTASGTVEAAGITVAPEVSGRVAEVAVAEGDTVAQGDVLVRLDATLLEAQRSQAEAGLVTTQATVGSAEAAADTARANLAAVGAGASTEQVAVARRLLEQAQRAYEVARDGYADLSEVERDAPAGIASKAQRDNAKAAVATARAQYDLTVAGARPEQVAVARAQVEAAEAQVDAARTQVDAAEAAMAVFDAQLARLVLAAPTPGTILTRAIEPGEVVMPGAALLTLGDLERLTVTVYVPEDRLGEVVLGQAVDVGVDSFPGEVFRGTVHRIADQAEFTPRNVQTVEGRKTTVFAVELALDPSGGKLKPGMPADVVFGP
jgi:multidrug resistance efflux pump